VVIDNEKAGFIAAEYLISLGFSEIAYLCGSENSVANSDRLTGYNKAIESHNLDSWIYNMKGSSFRRESGYRAASEAIKSGSLPQALICANDIVAISAIEAFENNGYDVPADISVMGFDDIAYAALHKINLTTVAQPKYEIGSLAAQIILDKVGNPSGIGEKITLEPALVKRGTCKKYS
jgi:LacI family transcriptional regulator